MGHHEAWSDPRTAALAKRLTRWRERLGGPGRRLPRFVWEEAVPLAREHGAETVARVFRIGARALAREMASAAVDAGMRDAAGPKTGFVDLGPVVAPSGAILELSGSKVTIRLPPGSPWSAVAELAQSLRGGQP